jgi:hypothetical protein
MILDTHRMVRDYSGQDSTTRTNIPFLRPDIIKEPRMAGEDGRAVGEARPLLLAAASG